MPETRVADPSAPGPCRPSLRRRAIALALLLPACSPRGVPPGRTPSPVLSPTVPALAPASPSPFPAPVGGEIVRFAAVGDIGDGSQRAASVARAIARAHAAERLDFLLLLGDLIYPNGNPAEYRRKFSGPYRPVLEASIETFAVLGNHDLDTDPAGIMERFGMTARYYTFTRGPVQFFALDTSAGAVGLAQRAWLEAELRKSRSPWRIAFMHVPLYSSGLHRSSPALQKSLGGLFERYGVQLALAAHDHDYERTEPIGGTTYIVAGGGCCPRPVARSGFTAYSAGRLHFVLVEASADTLEIEALDPRGSVLDRKAIVRSAVPGSAARWSTSSCSASASVAGSTGASSSA